VCVGEPELGRDVDIVPGGDRPGAHGLNDCVPERRQDAAVSKWRYPASRARRMASVTPARPSAWPSVAVAVPKPTRGIGFPELSTTAGTTNVAGFLPWPAPRVAMGIA
jgi:hypothetical protein